MWWLWYYDFDQDKINLDEFLIINLSKPLSACHRTFAIQKMSAATADLQELKIGDKMVK